MELRIKKLSPEAVVPAYATAGAAGLDLCACIPQPVRVPPLCGGAPDSPQETAARIPTGLAVEIPAGYVGLVFARSGLAVKQGLALANGVGVIDSDYRGELLVAVVNHSRRVREIAPGDRIAQLVIMPVAQAEPVVVSELGDTARGAGGFGSTGISGRD